MCKPLIIFTKSCILDWVLNRSLEKVFKTYSSIAIKYWFVEALSMVWRKLCFYLRNRVSSNKLGDVFQVGLILKILNSTVVQKVVCQWIFNLGWGCFRFCCRAYPSFKALNIILGIYGIGISEDTNQPSKNGKDWE